MEEIRTNVETFIKAIERQFTKEHIIDDYKHYVDETSYQDPILPQYRDFCEELKKLSFKYGIVIQAVGGVIQNTDNFQGYNTDLDSGDLMPIWEN